MSDLELQKLELRARELQMTNVLPDGRLKCPWDIVEGLLELISEIKQLRAERQIGVR